MPPTKVTAKVHSRTSPVITRNLSQNLRTLTQTSDRMASNTEIVKHEIITNVVDIPKFSGEPNTIDLDQYIGRIDTYIANKGISDDKLKIQVFKQSIDPEKGTARTIITYRNLDEEISNYKEYVKEFKKHFAQRSDSDPLRVLVKYLGVQPKPEESQTEFIGRLDAFGKQVEQAFEGTEWTEKNQSKVISLKHMARILMFASLVKSNKGTVAEKLFKDLNVNTQLGQVDYMIKGYAETDPSSSQYVFTARQQSKSPTRDARQSRSQSRGRSSSSLRPRSGSRSRTTVECYRCHKFGHIARECKTRVICENCQYGGHSEKECRNQSWCSYHRRVGHKTRDCRNKQGENFRQGSTEKDGGTPQ